MRYWRKRQPNLSYFRTWGCMAYLRILDPSESNSLVEPMNAYSLGMLQTIRHIGVMN